MNSCEVSFYSHPILRTSTNHLKKYVLKLDHTSQFILILDILFAKYSGIHISCNYICRFDLTNRISLLWPIGLSFWSYFLYIDVLHSNVSPLGSFVWAQRVFQNFLGDNYLSLKLSFHTDTNQNPEWQLMLWIQQYLIFGAAISRI